MSKNPRQTLKILTIKLIDLAVLHNLELPTKILRNTFKDSNQRRRIYDAINVLKAINLLEKKGNTLLFNAKLIKLVYPAPTQPEPLNLNTWAEMATWMHDPTYDPVYEINNCGFIYQ